MNKNFWKADSKPITRSHRSTTSYTPKLSCHHQLYRYRQFIWKNAKWLLALLLVTGVVGIVLYILEVEHRLQAEHNNNATIATKTTKISEVENLLINSNRNLTTIDHSPNTIYYKSINQTRGQYTRPIGVQIDPSISHHAVSDTKTNVRFMNSGGPQSIFTYDHSTTERTPVVTILPINTKQWTSTSTVRTIKETDFNANSNGSNGSNGVAGKNDWHNQVNTDSVVVISPQPKATPTKLTNPTFVPKYTVSVTSTVSSTTSVSSSTTKSPLPHVNEQNGKNRLAGATLDGPPVDDDDRLAINRDRPIRVLYPSKETLQNFGFTSGHQNNFGVPIEEDERILRMLNAQLAAKQLPIDNDYMSTTDLSVFRTRVSPTLPILQRTDATTEAFGRGKTNGHDG